MGQDETQSCKTVINSQGYTNSAEKNNYAAFSPYEEISPDVDVYQRRHARSDYITHQMPSLSQPIAVGMSHHAPAFNPNPSGFGFAQGSMIQTPSYMMNQRVQSNYNISPPKYQFQND